MTPIPSERIDRRIYMLRGHVRDVSDAIDELARDRDAAAEHEDAISREAISGDAEIWTEHFASRLRDPGEPISRSKAVFERFRAIDANSRATCATPARSFFSPLLLCRVGIEPAAPWSAALVQHKCSISAASVQSKCSFFAVEVQSFCLPFCSRIVARRPTLKASAMRTLFGASLTPRNPTTPYAPTRCR